MAKNVKVFLLSVCLTLSVFTVIFSQGSSNPEDVGQVMAEIEVLLKDEKYEELIEKSTNILTKYPNSGDIYFLRGIAYIQKDDMDRAFEDFTQALEKKLSETLVKQARKMLIVTSYRLNKFDITKRETSAFIDKGSDDSNDYMFRGLSYFYSSVYKLAIADFEKVLSLENGRLDIRRFLAAAYNKLGNYEKAADAITEELKVNPKARAEAYQIRAEAYRKLGKTELAELDEKTLRDLLSAGNPQPKLVENDLNALLAKASKLFNDNKWDETISTYNEIIKLVGPDEPGLYAIYFSRGRCYYNLEKFDLAMADYNEVIRRKPDVFMAYVFRGEIYIKQDKLDSAVLEFNKAIEIDPKELLSYRRRAEAFYLKKNYAEAVKDSDEVIKLDPKYISAWYYRGLANFELGNYKTALDDFSTFLNLDSGNAHVYRLRAKVYRKLGSEGLATIDEQRAIDLEKEAKY